MLPTNTLSEPVITPHRRIGFAKRLRLARDMPLGSILVLVMLITMAVFANLIAPFDPVDPRLPDQLQPPVFQGGSWSHPLGTDGVGQDILSRIIFGARLSLLIGAITLALGAIIGTVVGMISGYVGGKVDNFLMRVTDLTISYPILLLALLLAVIVGPKISNVVIVIAFVLWARFARVVRGDVLSIRERDYIALARVAGASPIRIMIRHILPNILNTVIVLASLNLGMVILTEASLSFLGAGVPPTEPAWGSMVALGRDYVTTAWWVPTMPGFAIMLAVLSLNLFGDWLRDKLDPTLRNL